MDAVVDRSPPGRGGSWAGAVAFVVGTQLAGLIGVPFTTTGSWYDDLDKAPFNPPSWVFAPAWTFLYVLVGVVGWSLWKAPRSSQRSRALALWSAQLLLNAAWTPIFFGAQRPGWALVDIVLLDVAVLATVAATRVVDRAAARLLLPYLAWVAFATVLNAWIVVANQ